MSRECLECRPRLAGTVTWLIGALWFFRDPVFSGFDTINGDRGDARLIVFLHEHWWRVLQGEATWRSPEMFAPAEGTLGYSDTFVLDTIVYAPLRLVGFDQFVAFQLTLMALTAIGFGALFTLMRRHLGLDVVPSCLLSATGAFANNVFIDTGHPQIYAVNIVALVVLVFVGAWRADDGRERAIRGGLGGLLVGLLLWSTFYFGWYTLFLGGIVVGLLAMWSLYLDGFEAVWRIVRSRWSMIAASVGGLLVGLVPFFATYLPVLDDSVQRSYADVAELAPRPLDLLNVGRHNVLWGWLIEPLLDGDTRLDTLNRAVAPTPVLLLTAAVGTVTLALAAGRSPRRPGVARLGAVVGAVAFLAFVMPIQFEFGGAWAWAHRFVPGATALRLFGRIEVVVSLMATLTVACWLSARSAPLVTSIGGEPGDEQVDPEPVPRRAWREWLLVALLAVIALEQMNTATEARRFDRSDELAVLDAVPPPPEGCAYFYVTDVEQVREDHTLISAIIIAHEIDVPTMNGYSGQSPPEWGLVPGFEGYEERVEGWIDKRDPGAPICSLELSTLTWTG